MNKNILNLKEAANIPDNYSNIGYQDVVHATEKAILVDLGRMKKWFPKSRCLHHYEIDATGCTINELLIPWRIA